MMLTLSSSERRTLRAKAHALTPVVMISGSGLTKPVLAEIDRALTAHELIKIRSFSDARDERAGWLDEICQALGAAPVQHIGKVLVVFRPLPPESEAAKARKRGQRPAAPRKTKKQMLVSR